MEWLRVLRIRGASQSDEQSRYACCIVREIFAPHTGGIEWVSVLGAVQVAHDLVRHSSQFGVVEDFRRS